MSRDDELDEDWQQALRIFRGEELEIDESKLESDFGEAVAIHRAAQAPLGLPEEAPSLDELAAQQDAEQAAMTADAPFVRIVPPSLAVAKSSGQQLVTSTTSASAGPGTMLQVVDWHGPDEDGTAVTITLANIGPPAGLPAGQAATAWPTPAVGKYRPFGRITFGVGGAVFVVEVDIPGGALPSAGSSAAGIAPGGLGTAPTFGAQGGSGVQVTLGASNVIVQVGMDPSIGSVLYMQLGAALTMLPTQKTAPLFRTRYIDGFTAGTTTIVLIPPFATQLYPIRRTDVSQQMLITIEDVSGETIDQFTLPANQQMAGPIPLPPDAYMIGVTNQGGNTSNVRLPFGLAL